jgi:hypothetical protein
MVMILMGENALLGQLEGVGHETQDFFGPCNGQRANDPDKSRFSGPNPFKHGPSNGFAPIKTNKSKRHIKNRFIGNFMYMSFAAAVSVFCVLYFML